MTTENTSRSSSSRQASAQTIGVKVADLEQAERMLYGRDLVLYGDQNVDEAKDDCVFIARLYGFLQEAAARNQGTA